jgi:L-amino acid N-acyltransferase YncA
MQIRKIELSDSPELLRLRNLHEDLKYYRNSNEVSTEDHEIWVARRASATGLYTWVAVDGNQLLGICYFDEILNGSIEISIRVFPDWRGTSCSQILMEHAIEEVKHTGVNSIVAMVHRDNSKSVRFFEKNNFKESVIQKNEFLELVLALD